MGRDFSYECEKKVEEIARKGGTPLVVAKNYKVLGIIYLKDIVKEVLKKNFLI